MSEELVGSPSPAEATPSATPQPATPAAPAFPVATPQVTPASATPSTPPEGFVPSYRIREAREAAVRQANEQSAREIAAIRAEAEQYRRQLHSLVGATPAQNQNPEVDAIRAQFKQVYPGLAELEELKDQIKSVLGQQQDYSQQIQHYWTTYGRQTMDSLYAKASETFGGNLSDEAKRNLYTSFVGFVQSSPEIESRYGNDPSLVDDFWKAFTSSFIDPVRRTAVTGAIGRVPMALPQDTPSGAPRSTPPPQMKDMDERANAAWAQFQQLKGQR